MTKRVPIVLAYTIFAFIVTGIASFWFVDSERAAAQGASGSQIMLSWQADTYAPPGYSGKTLPVAGSSITAGVDLFIQGRRVDLSGSRVNWFVDEQFHRGGPGLARVTLEAPNSTGGRFIQLRVVLPDHNNLARSVAIPVVSPEAVVGSSAPTLYASDAPFTLKASPYFFNVASPLDLQFVWSLGRIQMGGDTFSVTREMAGNASGATRLQLSVRNPSRPLERTNEQLILFTR